jgi:hypothetical protein
MNSKNMKTLAAFAVLVCLLSAVPPRMHGQEISAVDREKLKDAEMVADRFVERFRQTLDFGTVWKEFRSEQFGCRLIKSDLVTNVSAEEKAKIGTALLERARIALMNYYYLKSIRELSLASLYNAKEPIASKQLRKAEESSEYTRVNGKTPTNAKEIREFIIAVERIGKLYRTHMPRNVMRSAAWKANYADLTTRGGITHLGVFSGTPDFCVPENAKYYIVDRGVFYFYMVEDKGKMKVIELGVGN